MRLLRRVGLLSFPALLVAVMASGAILGVASSAAPLFLDAAGGATLERYLREAQGAPPAVTIQVNSAVAADVVEYRHELLREQLVGLAGAPIRTARGDVATLVAGAESVQIRIVARTGFLDHVQVVERGPDAGGVWLADATAGSIGVETGDLVTVEGRDRQVELPVAGVYRDLLALPVTPFWAPLSEDIFPGPAADVRPPAFMMLEWPAYLDLGNRLHDDQDILRWEFPLRIGPMTLEDGRRLAAGLRAFEGRLLDPTTQLYGAFDRANYNEPLTGWVSRAEGVVSSITGPVETVAIAGRVVALVVVGAAGLFVVRRRRVEYGLLHARGLGPARLGVRAAAEALVPVAAGGAAGLLAGWGLVLAFGPDGLLAPSVLRSAAVQAAVSIGLGVALLGAVVALSVRTQVEEATRRFGRLAGRVPWEAPVLVLAAAAFYETLARGTVQVEDAEGVARIDRLLLLFPILFLAGFAGLAVRGLRRLLPRLRATGRRWPAFLYLATRRLAAAPRPATSLVIGATLAVGILVLATTLSASIGATAGQRALLTVGSEVSVTVSGPLPVISDAPFSSTVVTRIGGAEFPAAAQEQDLDVLGVQPATFRDVAYWESGFSGSSLEDLLASLSSPDGSRVPAILVGDARPPADPVLRVGGYDLAIDVVGRAGRFPGIVGDRPMVVAATEALAAALEGDGARFPTLARTHEVWARADPGGVSRFLRSSGLSVVRTQTARELRDTPEYLALSWTLGFLQALGLLAGLVAVVGTVLYLQTRQREGQVAYALARRMGLRPSGNRSSVAVEIGGMLLAAFVAGAVLAVAAALLTYRRLELGPSLGELPLFRVPFRTQGLVLVALLVMAWVGSGLVQRRADRANVAEVMRLAD